LQGSDPVHVAESMLSETWPTNIAVKRTCANTDISFEFTSAPSKRNPNGMGRVNRTNLPVKTIKIRFLIRYVCDTRRAFGSELRMVSSQARTSRASLCLATLISGRQHARMPLLVLSVGIAEPSPAFGTVHGRREIARLVARRNCLAQSLHVALVFYLSHRNLVPHSNP